MVAHDRTDRAAHEGKRYALVIARDDLADRLSKTQRSIKPTLMDQKVLAGIGNIYADEILFHARVHPERRGQQRWQGSLGQTAAIGDKYRAQG